MKKKKSLYILLFLLIVIVAVTLVFEVAFDHPWDERVKMSLITIYIVYGVNLILFLPLLLNNSFDELISFFPFGWNIRRLYSIIALIVGITLAICRVELRYQIVAHIVMGIAPIGIILFILFSSEHIRDVKEQYSYVDENDKIRALFVRVAKRYSQEGKDEDIKERINRLADKFIYIAPSPDKTAQDKERMIKKELENILYDLESKELEKSVKKIELLVEDRMIIR